MDFYKDIICEHKFTSGFKKGQICLKYNCVNHDEYNCNLAWYLGLPANFCFFSKKIKKYTYFTLVNILNNSEKYTIIELYLIFKHLFMLFELQETNNQKEIIIIYIYTILDEPTFMKELMADSKFKQVIYTKLEIFKLNTLYSSDFLSYMADNFTINKRFLSIKKNSLYRAKIFRLYIKIIVICNIWFNETMEKRYTPCGNGAIEAKENFITALAAI